MSEVPSTRLSHPYVLIPCFYQLGLVLGAIRSWKRGNVCRKKGCDDLDYERRKVEEVR